MYMKARQLTPIIEISTDVMKDLAASYEVS
jgi:hypothetical protein